LTTGSKTINPDKYLPENQKSKLTKFSTDTKMYQSRTA